MKLAKRRPRAANLPFDFSVFLRALDVARDDIHRRIDAFVEARR